MMPVRPIQCPQTRTPRQARRSHPVRAASMVVAAVLAAGCATVTPGPFQITVRGADDAVLEQFQFQAGSQASLESAMIGMCRVYPDATVVAEQLQTHELLHERCKRSLASMLSAS
ncbi:hypothetical protein ACQUJS_10450 [Ralstonia pseudosolanacearum]|uniref:Uncharacterized protein n=1 Tax=Ralstonia solanacearum TaxID=305 RepID=A0A0S4TLA7_RALSL|nr:conserved protein of unknown function [Ralstonia solanacearum]